MRPSRSPTWPCSCCAAASWSGSSASATPMGRNYVQLLIWSAISGVIWIVGGCVDDPTRGCWLWAVAAGVDLAAPLLGFRLPHAGATPMTDWTWPAAHLAERCQLLLMIAFGESFLRIGESFADAPRHGRERLRLHRRLRARVRALDDLLPAPRRARDGGISRSAEEEAARLARSAYTYAHVIDGRRRDRARGRDPHDDRGAARAGRAGIRRDLHLWPGALSGRASRCRSGGSATGGSGGCWVDPLRSRRPAP